MNVLAKSSERSSETAHARALGRRAGRKYGGGPVWLVTFVDLVSLLLAFFVLRYAMLTPNAPEFEAVASSFAIVLGGQIEQTKETEIEPPEVKSVEGERTGRGYALGYLEPLLQAKLDQNAVLASAAIKREGERLVISLSSDILFQAGDTELGPRAEQAVRLLATALIELPNRIDVIGHADPRQPSGGRAANWELAFGRAESVAAALRGAGLRQMPLVETMGASRFDESSTDLTLEERYRIARRVDIAIFPERAR